MTDLCDNVENEIINWLFGGTDTRGASADVYVSLHTSDPGESPDGSTELDASSLSYQREGTAAGTDWNISANSASNSVEISFNQATEDWGTVSHFVLWDGNDGTENPLFSDVIRDSNGNSTTKTVSTDDTISFASGSLTAELD